MSEAPQDQPSSSPRRPGALRLALQVAGFALCLGLLAWCLRTAFDERNRAQLERLADASAGQIAALLGLSLLTVLVSGEVFRNVLRPVRRLGVLPIHATNAFASLLALLPFKLSIVARVLVHNRRDGLPLLTITAWFAAVSAVMACAIVPLLAVTRLRQPTDAVSAWLMLAGLLACGGMLLGVSRWLLTPRGWSVVTSVYSLLPKPRRLRADAPAGAALLGRAREGCVMLASPRAVLVSLLLRGLDVGVQGGRILVAAHIIGLELTPDRALLAGLTYFLVGAAAPSGQLGAREAAVTAVLGTEFAVVPLLITAVETLVLVVGSVLGIAYLRPDRLLVATPRASDEGAR